MKKFFALLLVACMALSLCACGDSAVETLKKDMVGTWTVESPYTKDEAVSLLNNYGFYPEEYAYTDLTQMKWIDSITFTEDGKYSFAYLAKETEDAYRAFFDNMMSDIYNNLDNESLGAVYGGVTKADFAGLDDFKTSYAVIIYEYESYDAFMDSLVNDILYNYYNFDDMAYDHGTYKVTSKGVEMTEDGDTTAYLSVVSVEGDTLKIEFSNETVSYTRK